MGASGSRKGDLPPCVGKVRRSNARSVAHSVAHMGTRRCDALSSTSHSGAQPRSCAVGQGTEPLSYVRCGGDGGIHTGNTKTAELMDRMTHGTRTGMCGTRQATRCRHGRFGRSANQGLACLLPWRRWSI